MNLSMSVTRAIAASASAQPARGAHRLGPMDDHSLQAMLDAIDYGTLLVDESLALLWCNRIGQRWLAAGTAGVELLGRVLHCKDRLRDAALRQAVQLAVERRVQSLVELKDCSVAVVPLGADREARLASLVLERPEVCSHFTLAAFSRQHQLSPAEGSVLRLLSRGLAPEAIARRNGVALSTVRSQVLSIRAKTGVGSVHELVIRLSRIPPMVGVLDDHNAASLS